MHLWTALLDLLLDLLVSPMVKRRQNKYNQQKFYVAFSGFAVVQARPVPAWLPLACSAGHGGLPLTARLYQRKIHVQTHRSCRTRRRFSDCLPEYGYGGYG